MSLETIAPPLLSKLFSADAVRERSHIVYRWAADGRSSLFTIHPERLPSIADYVADITRKSYPDLKIPYHSRWRHFSAGGIDRWSAFAAPIGCRALVRPRISADLVTVSVH